MIKTKNMNKINILFNSQAKEKMLYVINQEEKFKMCNLANNFTNNSFRTFQL